MTSSGHRGAKARLRSTSRSLPFALIRAREKVMAPIREMLAASGITEQQWRILRVLSEFGPQDGTLLSERTSLLPSSQTRIVQSMLERGYVTRTADNNDRRRQTVAITPAGQTIIDNHLDEAKVIAARFQEILGKDDLERLLEILAKLDEL